jgi:uncharacterized tellurite resistance protein B-like protein
MCIYEKSVSFVRPNPNLKPHWQLFGKMGIKFIYLIVLWLSQRSLRSSAGAQALWAGGCGEILQKSKGEYQMRDIVKRFFSKTATEPSKKTDQLTEHDVRIAACALFVEMARIDEKFTEAEMETILSIVQERYGLTREHADALVAEADKELDKSVDLWQFARLINENYSTDEKIEIIETLWRMVFVDGKMDRYEHYLMNKLKNLLRLSHDQLIAAKLKILHSTR